MPPIVIISIIIIVPVIVLAIILKNVVFSSRLDKATKLMDGGNYSSASKELKGVISKNNANSKAHFLLGECYINLENYEWAMPEYRTVLKLGNFSSAYPEHKVRSRIAQIFLHYGKLEEAQKEFLLMTKLQPNNFMNYFNIGKIFQERNFLDNAYTYFKKALSINPKHIDSLFKAGEISYHQKRHADALIELQDALNLDNNYMKAHYYLGMIFLSNKNYLRAVKEFEFSSRDEEFKFASITQKGRAYFEHKDYDKAIIELERAVRLIKSETTVSLAARYYLSLAYETKRQLDKAIEQWEAIANINPNYQDVQEKLANYSELRTDDKLKDFLIASQEDFNERCKAIIHYIGFEVVEMSSFKGVKADIIASESESKWRNTRKTKRVVKIFRTSDIIGESTIREVLEIMKGVGASKGMIVTTNKYSRQAVDYAQTRPIDLIDKDGLSKLLKKIDSQPKEENNSDSLFF
jgi:tetratricopeptide (TPR) repeat protein